ncbi:hypothetical protein QUB61_22710 [Microcoleus sp. C2D2]
MQHSLVDTPFEFGDVLRLESGNHGVLKKIGLQVTEVCLFESHTIASPARGNLLR